MRMKCLSIALGLLATAPAWGELVIPRDVQESRLATWIVLLITVFLAGLVLFASMLSSRRTHQD